MTDNQSFKEEREYDVAICGAGLAGLTLARQLKQEVPEVSVILIDKYVRPLPEAAFKVGESMVETGSHYFTDKLKLVDYFRKAHLQKMGFRFFFSNANGSFQNRPEFGLSKFPYVDSYQIDRGILENDLRRFNEEAGVTLMEGYSVRDIILSNGNEGHEVLYQRLKDKRIGVVRSRWVIDAMGRRRYLQKKLNLTKEHGQQCSSAWFRLNGRIDVSDLVPIEEKEWHERVPGRNRYYSTNHLMGSGYWVWLIPLASDCTSIGIVALEDYHPFEEFNTYKSALQWLTKHEPALAAYIGDRKPLDFKCMRKYSYASRKLLSHQRWACVGEAALFPDPFYALASDLIGFTNTVITEMVKLDVRGRLEADKVEYYDQFILSLNHWLTNNIQIGYPFFGNGVVMACKVMWDTAGGWASLGPRMFNSLYLDKEGEKIFRKVSGRYFFLTHAMQQLFIEWAAKSSGRFTYDFIDFLRVPLMRDMQLRNLQAGKSLDRIIEDQVINMEKLEEFAQALFLLAVEDTYPEYLHQFKAPIWLNAWAISLHPERWHKDGLFQPTTQARDLSDTREQIRKLFCIRETEINGRQ